MNLGDGFRDKSGIETRKEEVRCDMGIFTGAIVYRRKRDELRSRLLRLPNFLH